MKVEYALLILVVITLINTLGCYVTRWLERRIDAHNREIQLQLKILLVQYNWQSNSTSTTFKAPFNKNIYVTFLPEFVIIIKGHDGKEHVTEPTDLMDLLYKIHIKKEIT